jgi:hypothetical protein
MGTVYFVIHFLGIMVGSPKKMRRVDQKPPKVVRDRTQNNEKKRKVRERENCFIEMLKNEFPDSNIIKQNLNEFLF